LFVGLNPDYAVGFVADVGSAQPARVSPRRDSRSYRAEANGTAKGGEKPSKAIASKAIASKAIPDRPGFSGLLWYRITV